MRTTVSGNCEPTPGAGWKRPPNGPPSRRRTASSRKSTVDRIPWTKDLLAFYGVITTGTVLRRHPCTPPFPRACAELAVRRRAAPASSSPRRRADQSRSHDQSYRTGDVVLTTATAPSHHYDMMLSRPGVSFWRPIQLPSYSCTARCRCARSNRNAGRSEGGQAGPRQDDVADQLHVRRRRLRRSARDGGVLPSSQIWCFSGTRLVRRSHPIPRRATAIGPR